jgi:integrase
VASIKQLKGKRGVTYAARVRVNGHPSQCRNFKTKAEARDWALHTEAALTGRMFAVVRQVTLGDLIAEYLPKAKPATQPLLRYWAQTLGSTRLRDIAPPMVAQHRDALLGAPTRSHGHKRTKPRTGATVNQYLSALSVAFKYANERGLSDNNPVQPVKKCAPSRWCGRFLSDDERTRLMDAARPNPHLYAAVVVSVTTGLRRGNVMGIHWRDIDQSNRWVVIPKAKNGDPHGAALTPAALDAINALPRDGEKVFPFDLTKAWRAAIRESQIHHFRWHDLRHSAGSRLIANGANHVEVAQVLGHKTLDMVKRYAHLSNAHTRALIDQVMAEIR